MKVTDIIRCAGKSFGDGPQKRPPHITGYGERFKEFERVVNLTCFYGDAV